MQVSLDQVPYSGIHLRCFVWLDQLAQVGNCSAPILVI
jgi:hypothetical protein